jgi:hypothetical protein
LFEAAITHSTAQVNRLREAMLMTDVALLLGPIAFQDFEVPSGVNFGGRQRLAVHRLPSGRRIVDTLGRDEADICFTGIFTGPDATLRARGIDEMRVAGIALPLTWDVFFYTVLIAEFYADYCSGSWIPYWIRCTVLQDEASLLTEVAVSLASAVIGDVSSAAAYADGTGIDLAGLQPMLAAQGAMTRGTAPFVSAQASLTGAASSIANAATVADDRLTATNSAPAATAQDGVDALLSATDTSGQLASLVLASAYTRRAAANHANASS